MKFFTYISLDNTVLDFLTSLEVSCVAGEDGCNLEASCMSAEPAWAGQTGSAGSEYNISSQLSTIGRNTSVSCDNQTINYTGTAHDSMLRGLGCPRSGVTKCPQMRGTFSNFKLLLRPNYCRSELEFGRYVTVVFMYSIIRLHDDYCCYSVVSSQHNSAGLLCITNRCYYCSGTGSVGEDTVNKHL